MIACWSKPLFSGAGSCLGFPTLTQKLTLAHGSRKPAAYEEGGKEQVARLESGVKGRSKVLLLDKIFFSGLVELTSTQQGNLSESRSVSPF